MRDREQRVRDGQAVGSDAGALEAATDGLESTRHRGARAAVEHVRVALPRAATNGARRYHRTPRRTAVMQARVGIALVRPNRDAPYDPARPMRTREVAREDVPDGEDPQRGPGGPRRSRARPRWPRRCCFTAGAIPRTGRVEDGTTVCDFDPEEARARGISVSLALAPFELDGHKVNVIDTPGYADFVGDVAAALRVADLAVFVVSAVEGVEVQTEVAWRMADELGLPRIVFVNKLDRERASFERTLDQLKDSFGAGVAPLELPIGEEGRVPRRDRAARRHRGDLRRRLAARHRRAGARRDGDEEHSVHDALVEGIVVADDDLMERYLADETIDGRRARPRARQGHRRRRRCSRCCAAARRSSSASTGSRASSSRRDPRRTSPATTRRPALFVFKTIVDPYVGRVNLFKVLQGTVKPDATLVNGRTVHDERLHQLTTMRGKEQEPATEVARRRHRRGRQARRHDHRRRARRARRRHRGRAVRAARRRCSRSRSTPKSKGDEDKLANALHRLLDEDPALRLERNAETHQTLLWGMGETHLVDRARDARPQVRRRGRDRGREGRRTARRSPATAEAEGKYKKQTRRPRPVRRSRSCGSSRSNAAPASSSSTRSSAARSPASSSPRSRRASTRRWSTAACSASRSSTCGSRASTASTTPSTARRWRSRWRRRIGFKEAMAKADPILLEPVSELVVTVPEANQGDIMGDLNSKRGRIQGSSARRQRRGRDRRDGARRRRCCATRSTCAR